MKVYPLYVVKWENLPRNNHFSMLDRPLTMNAPGWNEDLYELINIKMLSVYLEKHHFIFGEMCSD